MGPGSYFDPNMWAQLMQQQPYFPQEVAMRGGPSGVPGASLDTLVTEYGGGSGNRGVAASVGPTGAPRKAEAVLQRIDTLSRISGGQQIQPQVLQTMENLGYAKSGRLTPLGEAHLSELQALLIK